MEFDVGLNKLVDFLLFEKEWPFIFTSAHLSETYKAIEEFADIYDIELKRD